MKKNFNFIKTKKKKNLKIKKVNTKNFLKFYKKIREKNSNFDKNSKNL